MEAPLDRSIVERKDFPISRRGYDPAAVDAHLRALANRFEESRRKPDTLATAASEQVQSIVAAAESSAAEIRSQAEAEGRARAQQAQREAESMRADATRRSQEYMDKVREATTGMLERVRAVESELQSMIGSVRSNGERLKRDLAELTSGLDQLSAAGGVWTAPVPPPSEADGGKPEEASAAAPAPRKAARRNASKERNEEKASPPSDVAPSDEEEKARLIALDMAHGGTPREETDRHLADKFRLDDRDKLLDEIYAQVGSEKG